VHLVSYRDAEQLDSWGVRVADTVVDLGVDHPELGWPRLVDALSDAGVDGIRAALDEIDTAAARPADELTPLPVVPAPGKILCVGLNFEEHRIETGRERTPYPVVFTRFPDSVVGHRAPLVRPVASERLDFEGEVAVVIGRGGRRIPESGALAHVAGLTCFNDGSVRDFQAHTPQFTPGKNFPASGAMGPSLVTLDEVGDLDTVELTTRLNGTVVQQAVLSDLTHSIPEIIAYCSSWTELRPGDVIATGTPGGIGARRTPPLWMAPGDVCEVEVGRVGVLRNPVDAER
jgi:2-keto-4-pentenoate hydratase/2-oxohepta-3-ene-1,7-dioic acid hydratase in catechol pathway